MSSLVFFGSTPGSNSLVSEENRSRGINFCRAVPSTLNIVGMRQYTHPSYELFLDYFPFALKTIRSKVSTPLSTAKPYYAFNGKNVSPFCRDPRLVWTYLDKKPQDFLDAQKARFNAVETTAGGKPALSAILSVSQVRSLINDTQPSTVTDVSVNTLNIVGYKTYRHLHALAHACFRTFQYALTEKDSGNAVERARYMVAVADADLEKPTGWAATHKSFTRALTTTKFVMNLPTEYDTCDHRVTSSVDIPNGNGLIFPFVTSLARDDPSFVPRLLEGPLNGLHGETMSENAEMLGRLVGGWKTLHITEWGSELTHMFIGISLAMETGAGIRSFVTPQGVYAGFILTGSFFSVFVNGTLYTPQPFGTLQTDFAVASPHAASLASLYDMINFPSDLDRVGARGRVNSLYGVSADIRKFGYNINDQETMARHLRGVMFVKDKYLTLNGTNLARVLTCMATGIGESEIPLHHLAVFKNDKNHRLLSAFGAGCPSFIINGGRKMELTGNFGFKKTAKVKGKQMEVTVNTMYVAVKPLEAAIVDLDRVLSEKAVMSIAGTPAASRLSARAMIREFDGNYGNEVLAALRQVAKVSVSANPGSSKRKGEELAEDEEAKRAKVNFDDI